MRKRIKMLSDLPDVMDKRKIIIDNLQVWICDGNGKNCETIEDFCKKNVEYLRDKKIEFILNDQ